jgi:hypothetical protein
MENYRGAKGVMGELLPGGSFFRVTEKGSSKLRVGEVLPVSSRHPAPTVAVVALINQRLVSNNETSLLLARLASLVSTTRCLTREQQEAVWWAWCLLARGTSLAEKNAMARALSSTEWDWEPDPASRFDEELAQLLEEVKPPYWWPAPRPILRPRR